MIGFALDMDGTVYHGDRPIPGAKEFIQELSRRGIPFRFITNNSSHTREFYAARLARLGFGTDVSQILTSTTATIRFIKENRPGKTVFPIATPDVLKEIEDSGVPICKEGRPDIVLLTFDITIDYAKINAGYHYIMEGSEFIATHPDDVCPTETGYDVDIGPFIRLYESLTRKDPIVVGKPNRLMLDMAALEMGVPADKVIMVGDRLSTDIRMAVDAGVTSVLVLSGETDRALLETSGIEPTFVLDSVADIVGKVIDP
ncbi:MAG: HAD-IIA family hydrolase [archaeon]|nr:HAD-IIA family hydrolase [archaeon]